MHFGRRILLVDGRWGNYWLGTLLAGALLLFLACKPPSDFSATGETRDAAGAAAAHSDADGRCAERAWATSDPRVRTEALWRAVRQHYAKLPYYRDRASVQLQYEIAGNRMFESMPCAVVFDRSTQRWQGRLFRTQLEGDSRGWIVRIREAATHDFDQQVKQVCGELDWSAIAGDDVVAGVYLSGATDVPLSERMQAALVLALPQLAWLRSVETLGPGGGGDPARSLPGPAMSEAETCYLGWTWYRERFCVKFSTRWRGAIVELWVDPQALLVRRMELPASVLNDDLAAAPEVRNVQLAIEFGDIDVDEKVVVPAASPLRSTERLVRNFVKIPESFPSPWVGRVTRPVTLSTQRRTAYRLPAQSGGSTVALCLPQVDASAAWWECLRSASERHADAKFCLVLDAIESPAARAPVVATAVARPTVAGEQVEGNVVGAGDSVTIIPYGAEAWPVWGLNQGRWLVVWDAAGTMQYAGAVDRETLPATIDAILHRVQRGDAVGREMITEYQAFLTTYWEQLNRESVLQERSVGD